MDEEGRQDSNPMEGHRHPVDCGVASGGSSQRPGEPKSSPSIWPPASHAMHPARQVLTVLSAACTAPLGPQAFSLLQITAGTEHLKDHL